MDERIDGIMAYEREATAARDEAMHRRSYANALRRGDVARAEEQRDSWSRSRAAWPADAQEHLREAEKLDAQARAWERMPLDLLRTAPSQLFALYRGRRAEHRAAQRAFIIANPGAIPDARLRITWLSRLHLAEPALDVTAYVDRTVRELADAARGGGHPATPASRSGQRRTAVPIVPGAVVDRHAAKPSLYPLHPWTDDQRPLQDVIAAAVPTFLSMTRESDKPIFRE
jgi:hypothetical protein